MNDTEKKLAADFERFIDSQSFQHFAGKEFTWYWDKKRNGQKNTVPPRALWGNILPTLKVLDFFRGKIRKPIIISSSYRSPLYNAAIDGASQSYHTKFQAIDFTVPGMKPSLIHDGLTRLRANGVFKGGLGLYSTFVHIDTRGFNADWRG